MDCNSPVDSFHFALVNHNATSSDVLYKMNTMLKAPFEGPPRLPLVKQNSPASTDGTQRDGIAVLRIDNVPWV